MSCPTCNNGNGPIVVGGLSQLLATVNAPCNNSLCATPQDSKCTFYTGAALPCSGINSQDSIEVALQKIDSVLCSGTGGSYASYNVACLSPVTTPQSWVEKISQYVCGTQQQLSTFTSTTFPAYQTSIQNQIDALVTPGTTSACSGNLPINTNDSQSVILQKLSSAICDIYDNQLFGNIAAVNWNQCNTVTPTPTNLTSAFNAVLGQICALQNNQGAQLPIFDNTGSCLPTPTATDTLVQTISKIKSVLCNAPVFNANTLAWNCISKPTSIASTDLNTAFNAVLAKLDSISQNFPNFNGSQFSSTATNPSNPCAGLTISLNSSISDRLVAASTNDNAPGVLSAKLVGDGTTIEVDYTSVTQGVIKAIGGGAGVGNGKVFADGADSTSDYLINKLENSSVVSGIGVVFNLDSSSGYHKVQPALTIDPVALFTSLLDAVSSDTTGVLQQLFCGIVAACPTPCAAPSNISIVYNGSSTTSTTTTIAPTTTTTTTTTVGGPTTTTTTSSTTTTTTTLNTVFFGAQVSATPPSAGTVAGSSSFQTNASNNVNVDFTSLTAATPLYCFCAIPSAYPKTTYYMDPLNNGTIGGGGSLFASPTLITISGVNYDLYFTNYATQFTEITQMEA